MRQHFQHRRVINHRKNDTRPPSHGSPVRAILILVLLCLWGAAARHWLKSASDQGTPSASLEENGAPLEGQAGNPTQAGLAPERLRTARSLENLHASVSLPGLVSSTPDEPRSAATARAQEKAHRWALAAENIQTGDEPMLEDDPAAWLPTEPAETEGEP